MSNAPQFGFIWYFLMTKIRLYSFQNNTTELLLYTSQRIIPGDTCCWFVPLLLVLWSLSQVGTCRLLNCKVNIFFVINKYLVGREDYKYAVSHHTFLSMNFSIHWWFLSETIITMVSTKWWFKTLLESPFHWPFQCFPNLGISVFLFPSF